MSTVQSIDRAFAVLRALIPGSAGVTEIADRVNLPKSTVSRLLSTLEGVGAVEQVSVGGEYRVGSGMAEIAAAASPGRSLVAAARPQLVDLSRATGEAVGVSVRDGSDMLYLDQVNPEAELQVRDWTGTRIPMHAVPSGQVVLASMPYAEVDVYFASPFESFTPHTIVDPDQLRRRLSDVRRVGYAIAIDEFAEELSSVAAPIFDGTGRVAGAVHVFGPTYRFNTERDPVALGALVVETAGRIRVD
jgi:DNA-binding IclR family transcriptional regulator